jgi:cyclopropane fatty-acyl-phospholipid synthase-like methyltransferase
MWNERYSRTEYIYGEEPNKFLEEQLPKVQPGVIIFPCEGEGRNAVYAATLGWEVLAFDSSEAGKAKAMKLAQMKNESIDYQIQDANDIEYPDNSADAIAFIYAHFPTELRNSMLAKANKWLKPGGTIILEAFNPLQLNNTSGGPKDPNFLYTEEILTNAFPGFEIKMLESVKIELNEGAFHQGMADVVRFVGVKR